MDRETRLQILFLVGVAVLVVLCFAYEIYFAQNCLVSHIVGYSTHCAKLGRSMSCSTYPNYVCDKWKK